MEHTGMRARAMSSDAIYFMTATELVGLIRGREVSAREVMEAHLRRIELVKPRGNAIVTLVAEQALDGAGAAVTGGRCALRTGARGGELFEPPPRSATSWASDRLLDGSRRGLPSLPGRPCPWTDRWPGRQRTSRSC